MNCHRKACQHPREDHRFDEQAGERQECQRDCHCFFYVEPEAVPVVQAPWVEAKPR